MSLTFFTGFRFDCSAKWQSSTLRFLHCRCKVRAHASLKCSHPVSPRSTDGYEVSHEAMREIISISGGADVSRIIGTAQLLNDLCCAQSNWPNQRTWLSLFAWETPFPRWRCYFVARCTVTYLLLEKIEKQPLYRWHHGCIIKLQLVNSGFDGTAPDLVCATVFVMIGCDWFHCRSSVVHIILYFRIPSFFGDSDSANWLLRCRRKFDYVKFDNATKTSQ